VARTGISTYGEHPELVGPEYLEELFQHARDVIPDHAHEDTPLFLLATAGMRLLPMIHRKELINQICTYARKTTKFSLPECDLHIQVIPGETEGLYGWVAANYLLGGFDDPKKHHHGKGHHTYGFLDMGGASAQIAFAPNSTEVTRHAEDLKKVSLRTLNGVESQYQIFVTTWLGFGVNEARRRYIDALKEASHVEGATELPDPCLPVGVSTSIDGNIIVSAEANSTGPQLIGTGHFDECLRQTYPLLDKDAPCKDEPCLLNGVHVPAIDFSVNHFVGVSEYWHTTHEVFGMGHKEKAYDFNTYQAKVKEFCSQDWKTIEDGVSHHKWGKKVDEDVASEVCFKASWLINVLHNGIGVPRVGLEDTHKSDHNATEALLGAAKDKGFIDPFQAVDRIENVELSWTLGKMVLYAASQVPPNGQAGPVGFGKNVPGISPDFQYAGAKGAPQGSPDDSNDDLYPEADDGEDWHDKLFDDSSRRIPGFVIFLLIACFMLYLMCGRERRQKFYNKIRGAFGKPPSNFGFIKRRKFNGSNLGSYDRLEAGERAGSPAEFELGDVVSSDDNDGSDSSSSSRTGRTSGWHTPRLKAGFANGSNGYFESIVGPGGVGLGLQPVAGVGNAMDRTGLVARTESRDKLSCLSPGLPVNGHGGRRSRAGSPTRVRSPMAPFAPAVREVD
jgi:golgi apyrase